MQTQAEQMHGPPMDFTRDWGSAELSVLRPEVAATGHGVPLRGESMRAALDDLARDFRDRAVPRRGVYAGNPAVADERGVSSYPTPSRVPMAAAVGVGVGLGVLAGLALASRGRA